MCLRCLRDRRKYIVKNSDHNTVNNVKELLSYNRNYSALIYTKYLLKKYWCAGVIS